MIIELICTPLLLLTKGIIAMFPTLDYLPESVVNTFEMLVKAMLFFPNDVWITVIGNIIFWVTLHLIWGIVKFVLGLIPFVNMGG